MEEVSHESARLEPEAANRGIEKVLGARRRLLRKIQLYNEHERQKISGINFQLPRPSLIVEN